MTTIRITRWTDGGVCWEGAAATIKEALVAAVAAHANLSRAALSRADLSWANLSGANLFRADLSRADLSGADLSRADLFRAQGMCPERCMPLLMLRDQPGLIRAYKLVTTDGVGPFNGGITYVLGQSYAVTNANTDTTIMCAEGIHVATLDWCLKEWQRGYRVLVVEFTAADIAAIPTGTDGKFRLHRCTVVDEIDLVARGLVSQESTT